MTASTHGRGVDAARLTLDIKAIACANPAIWAADLLPSAKRYGRSWRVGSVAGEAGTSLWISDDGRWHDHATGDNGDPFDLVQAALRCDFTAARAWLGARCGIDTETAQIDPAKVQRLRDQAHARQRAKKAQTIADTEAIQRQVRELLSGTQDGNGTPVETYIRYRTGEWRPEWGAVLRWMERCPDGRDVRPAMVAPITSAVGNEPQGAHRTYLRPDGRGKAAIETQKKVIGQAGQGVIRLSPDEDVSSGLGIAEGIETALSVMAQGWTPVWAAVSAYGVGTMPVLSGVDALTIFADDGDAGRDQARACAQRWADAGREVMIHIPQRDDFNTSLEEAA